MKFMYKNHRGETAERNVTPIALCFFHDPGKMSKHLSSYAPGLFIEAMDKDRGNALRHFAVSRIVEGLHVDDTTNDFRMPIPVGPGTENSSMSIYKDGERDEYFAGFMAGHDEEQFDFDRTTKSGGHAWAHGYNDGRRLMLEDE